MQRKPKGKALWIILGILTLLFPALCKDEITKVIVLLLMLSVDAAVFYFVKIKPAINNNHNKTLNEIESGLEKTERNIEVDKSTNYTPERLIEIGRICTNTVNKATDPFLFFSNFKTLIATLKELIKMESHVKFINKPSQDLMEIMENKEIIIDKFIDRSFDDLKEKLKQLTSYRDINDAIDIYYEIMFQNKDNMTVNNGAKFVRLVDSLYAYYDTMRPKDEYDEYFSGSYEKRSKIASILDKKWLDIAAREFIAIDIETTGLSKTYDKMVEVAAIKYNHGVEIDKYVTLINPKVIIPAEVILIHNITNEMVKNAPTIDKVIPELLNFLGDSLLVGHNANFDIGFIEVAAIRLGYSPFWNYVDTVSVAKKIFGELGLPNYKQGTILDAIGYKQKEYHRAEDDCRGCAEIMNIAINSLMGGDDGKSTDTHNLESETNDTEIISNTHDSEDLFFAVWKKTLMECKAYNSDLVVIGDNYYYNCEECAKYRNRVYSLSGKDKRFPKLPDFIYNTGYVHETIYYGCCSRSLSIRALVDESFIGIYLKDKDPIISSNRPFVDDRTPEEKEAYEKYLVWAKAEFQKEQEQQRDRANYDLLHEFLPEAAPKSFGGYRRMKGAKTKNYLILVEKAREKNIILEPDDNSSQRA